MSSPLRLFIYYNERALAGAVGAVGTELAAGYDHAKRLVTFRNSWGTAWGDRGDGHLPYAFFTSPSLTWDSWTMRRVS